jgi:cytochrome c peroxidase
MALRPQGNLQPERRRRLEVTFQRRAIRMVVAGAVLWLSSGCHAVVLSKTAHLLPLERAAYVVPLPAGFPTPLVPSDNSMTPATVTLGRSLFYDTRLSFNETQSCASCHQQRYAFTDGRRFARGSTGADHFRNTMGLANVAYEPTLTWGDPRVRSLEAQVLVPLTNEHPVEMGFARHREELVNRLRRDGGYARMFADAFPDQPEPVTIENVAKAIASFERTIISGRSPYDRLVHDADSAALGPSARRGMQLFFSERLNCSACHGGFTFGGSAVTAEGNVGPAPVFHNTGTYDGKGDDSGLASISHRRRDVGLFRAPSLRNVALTAPYMHDGSMVSLEQVIDHYAAGGPPRRGQKVELRPFVITPQEKQDLIEFLQSLTDTQLLTDAQLAEPHPGR